MGSNPVTALILSGVFSAIANITARLQSNWFTCLFFSTG